MAVRDPDTRPERQPGCICPFRVRAASDHAKNCRHFRGPRRFRVELAEPKEKGRRGVSVYAEDELVLVGVLEPRRVHVTPAEVCMYQTPAGAELGEAARAQVEREANERTENE